MEPFVTIEELERMVIDRARERGVAEGKELGRKETEAKVLEATRLATPGQH